jgi:hypothetical protein
VSMGISSSVGGAEERAESESESAMTVGGRDAVAQCLGVDRGAWWRRAQWLG